ncbi:hypothetical protein F5B19DRAFT_495814 [Rostrohypoxylon terebratum]|nr:hypothetical protein F5B19DRAFT_495814 [Rostrohypoxylon terebratum]
MAALSLVLVALRLYTRIKIAKFIGAEDYMYAWTGVFLLLFATFIQVSVHYGLGHNFWKLSINDSSNAIFWTQVANSFAITGNSMAKLSMGLFLLRVIQVRWHKIAPWVAVAITTTTSTALTVMLWNQTTPIKTSWDSLRTPGTWNIRIQPISVGLGVAPYVSPGQAPASGRDDAGACGITRTIVLPRLDVFDYTLNFVSYFAWAGAEIAVAMVCLGVPTLRPLYLKTRGFAHGYSNHCQDGRANGMPRFVTYESRASNPRSWAREPDFPYTRKDGRAKKPPPAHEWIRARKDSVENIFSDYQNQHAGVIWVKNEVHVQEDVAEWPLRG